MRKPKTIVSKETALAVARDFEDRYQAVRVGSVDAKDALTKIRDSIRSIMDQTNVDQYAAALATMLRVLMFIDEDFRTETPVQLEDTHYMDSKDVLAAMAQGYYQNPAALVLIMKRNSIYNTDEAILKGVLKVNRGTV